MQQYITFLAFGISSTFCQVSNDVRCEEFKLSSWFNHGDISSIKTCFMKSPSLSTIKNAGTFSPPSDDTVEGINLSGNRNVRFLPVNPAEKFPNLISFDARSSSIEDISRSNFVGLTKLVKLYLENNLIKRISDDTFGDLIGLEYLSLSKMMTLLAVQAD